MKINAVVLALLCSLNSAGLAQTTIPSIDSLAKSFQCKECKQLKEFTLALTQPYSTPHDQARAIFAWIATHVRYDFKEAKNLDKTTKFTANSLEELEQKKRTYYEEKIPQETYRTRKGICQDYSYLFKQMCTYVGIECVVVSGVSKGNTKKISKVGHAWNAFKLEDRWYLVDATWAAGYGEKGEFHRRYAPGFFMTNPRLFGLNHLPKDEKWQLLDNPISDQTFKNQPWLDYGQYDYPIEDAQPLDVPLTKEGKKTLLRIKFKKSPPVMLLLGKGKKEIPYQLSMQEGYTVLKFDPKSYRGVEIYSGKSRKGKLMGMAKFYVD